MNKEFIPYEQSLELKELGFNELCLFYYEDNEALRIYHQSEIYDDLVGAPLYQQAFRWFREEYGLDYEITYAGKKGEYKAFINKYIYDNNGYSPSVFSYEEAELECLNKLIEIVKENNLKTQDINSIKENIEDLDKRIKELEEKRFNSLTKISKL